MSSTSSPSSKKRPHSELEEADDGDDVQDDCCGICYVESGVSIPGEIDCCNHHFCFVCIMEWAKHESRCPICRQRFSNVRRLPKDGIFSSSRDIKVPLRDQVYHPLGNMTSGPAHSYAEVKCSVCHVGTDENLLLLCDLCDTASHAYCVGLGYTVPEGDWFCHDCAISRENNANGESGQQNVEQTADPGVTILNIVRETSSLVGRRPRASPLRQNNSPSSAIPLLDRVSRSEGKKPMSEVQRAQHNVQLIRENWNSLRSGSLSFRCKSFHSVGTSSQKQDSGLLSRDKLNDSSSVAFKGRSCNILNDGDLKYDVDKAWKMMDRAKTMQQTHRKPIKIPRGVDDPTCSGSREISYAHRSHSDLKNQQPRTSDSRYTRMEKQCDYSTLNRNLENHRPPMLGEKRQSRVTGEEMIQHLSDHTDSTHSEGHSGRPFPRKVHTGSYSAPHLGAGERNVVKEQRQSACLVTSVGLAPSCGKSSSVSNKYVNTLDDEKRLAKSFGKGITKVHTNSYSAPHLEAGERNAVREQRQSACLVTSVGSAPSCGKSSSVSNKVVNTLSDEKRLAKSFGKGITKVHTSSYSAPRLEDGGQDAVKEQRQSACLVTSVGSAPSCGKSGSVSNKAVNTLNDEKRLAKSFGKGITKTTEDAKTEIQSLVKLNLKCLTRDKKLDVDTFKVVARQATHMILAACSYEKQGSNISSSSNSVCNHTDHVLQSQNSSLMPNCCRQCFHVYVNNVVRSIFLEKVGCGCT